MRGRVVCPICRKPYAWKEGMRGPTHGLACPECKKDLPKLAEAYGVTVEELKEAIKEEE